MQIDSVQLVVYSPTGTTRRVLAAVAEGVGAASVSVLDLTLPATLPAEQVQVDAGLVLVGAPVYGGRVPLTQMARLSLVRGTVTPAALVVVYGNRAWEDALVELEDWAHPAGFVPFAGAAFVGEHSFSSEVAPIAPGRPDDADLASARRFGAILRQRMASAAARSDLKPIGMPGDRPYRERSSREPVAPETDPSLCTLCGACAAVCPTQAVSVGHAVTTDARACTLCCACIRACPTGARAMLDQSVLRIARWLSTDYGARREPKFIV